MAQRKKPLVWSASKHEQKTSEAPSSVSIITPMTSEIRLSQPVRYFAGRQRILCYLRPGLSLCRCKRIQASGRLQYEILLLTDGHRINDNVYQQAFVGADFPVDTDLIDRVEITRGPGSCLYGGEAFFGVVNVIPKAKDIDGFEVSAEAGSWILTKAE